MRETTLPALPKVLITGSREWTGESMFQIMRKRLERLPHPITLIHGGARGADTMAGWLAEAMGHRVEVHLAEWERYGRSAGHLRNEWMLDRKPDIVLAFATDIKTSRGTRHCALKAHELGYPLEIHQPNAPLQKFNMPPLTHPELAK